MSLTFEPRFDVLPPAQRALWPRLAPAPQFGFVLYGGTAVALRLGHRGSVDFDFFSQAPLDREAMHRAFAFLAGSTVLQEARNTLTVVVDEDAAQSVKLSFFGSIGFGRVGEPGVTTDGVLQVASLDDLMATKLKVILQRAEAKDYLDIAALLKAGTSLPKGLAAARALFGPNFQPSESLKALGWFKDGDLSTLSRAHKASLVKAAGAVRELPPVAIVSHRLGVED